MQNTSTLKKEVKEFWNKKSCGEIYAHGQSEKMFYASQSKSRYTLEPYIIDFAKFHEGHNKDILEIGVGMGSDHAEWAKYKPKSLTGIDLTPRAIEHTKSRLSLFNLTSDLKVTDAESLPFPDNSFDLVYSYGVLHHSPDTAKAITEVFRVLRTGGIARIMVYHKYSLTGYMLWIRYALLKCNFFKTLDDIYFNYLESPGTKCYSTSEANALFNEFTEVNIKIQLTFGDLLEGEVGQRHKSTLLSIAKKLWPRTILKRLCTNHGLALLIEAKK